MNPIEVGYYLTPGLAVGIEIQENNVFIADGNFGLRIIDVSNPIFPFEKGFYHNPFSSIQWTLEVQTNGNYAFLADYYKGLIIIDINSCIFQPFITRIVLIFTIFGFNIIASVIFLTIRQRDLKITIFF